MAKNPKNRKHDRKNTRKEGDKQTRLKRGTTRAKQHTRTTPTRNVRAPVAPLRSAQPLKSVRVQPVSAGNWVLIDYGPSKLEKPPKRNRLRGLLAGVLRTLNRHRDEHKKSKIADTDGSIKRRPKEAKQEPSNEGHQ